MPNDRPSSREMTEPNPDGTIAWRALLAEATDALQAVSESPALDARRIIETAAGFEPAEYAMGLDDLVTTRGMAAFDRMVARRRNGEPLQYVVGSWGFRTLDLMVDRRVLIPRPETEMVAGLAIEEIDVLQARKVVDLGTGSGAIALSMAVEREVEVWASDVSTDALAVARANLGGVGRAATRVTLCEGSWFDALPVDQRGCFDVIVSNPPYVADAEQLPAVVADWEPHVALFAGEDGTDALVTIIDAAHDWLTENGTLVLEMAPQQTARAAQLCVDAGFATAVVISDQNDRDRAVVARKRATP